MTARFIGRLALLCALSLSGAAPAWAQTVPGAPGTPVVTTGLGAITVVWTAPVSGGAPTSYRLDFYSASPRTLLAVFHTAGTVFSAAVANGTYIVSISAMNAGGTGPAAPDVQFTVGPAGMVPPMAPVDLRAVVVGQTVTLSWNVSAASSTASSFWVELGTAHGSSNLGVYDTGSGAPNVTRQLQPGLYFARVRGRNAAGVGLASADVTFTVTTTAACSAPPFAPINLRATITGAVVALAWNGAPSGAAATSHVIEAGSAPGQSDVARFATGVPSTVITTSATSGTYYVRVRAANACGVGLPSNEIVVAVP